MNTPFIFVMFVIAVSASSERALAVFYGDDPMSSPGTLAIKFKKTNAYWYGQRFGLFDGLISNDQTESKRIDRRLSIGAGAGVEKPFSANLSVRLDLRGEAVTRKQLDNASPETTTTETYMQARPSAAVTYITPAGLEIYGGGVGNLLPAYTRVVKSSSDTTTIKYGSAQFFAPYVGLTRRGGFGAGGIYYLFGKEKDRSIEKKAADGTVLNQFETKQEPTTLGVYSLFSGVGAEWQINGAAVSEGEGGERTDMGSPVRDDHLELSVSAQWATGVRVGAGHSTARYAKSAYMDLDTIPMTSLSLMWFTAPDGSGLHLGVIGGIGRDKQSIPEINARLEVNAVSVVGGVYGSF